MIPWLAIARTPAVDRAMFPTQAQAAFTTIGLAPSTKEWDRTPVACSTSILALSTVTRRDSASRAADIASC
eukprot:8340306-Prorocentrum_lima.AAC.1